MKELIERLRTHTENCSECESTPKMGDWSGVCDRCADMSQAADALERYQWRPVSEGELIERLRHFAKFYTNDHTGELLDEAADALERYQWRCGVSTDMTRTYGKPMA